MSDAFDSDERESDPDLQPLRVPMRREELYAEAKDMVADLAGWELVRADDASLTLHCRLAKSFLRGPSEVTIRVDGPEGIPSASVTLRSETRGGFLPRDRANVQAFMRPFRRRVG